MKKWLIVLVVVGVGGWLAYTKYPALKSMNAADKSVRQSTAVAEQRSISFSVSAAGEIGPAEQVSVKPEINGRIDLLPVDIGDRIKKGAILFTLDDKELQNRRSSSLTDIERAKLQLEQSERNYHRSEGLFKADLLPRQDYENARTEYDLAKNSVERAQRDIAILEEQLTKTKIVAPFDATILTRPVSMGQAVSGSGGFNSGTEVLTIADLNDMIINAHINQADITRLKSDQEVEVAVEAVAGLKVIGKVERIAPQATIKNNIKGFAVRILLKNVDAKIRPGMTANIKIPVGSADNVVAVPLAAVFTDKNADTGRPERYVYVVTQEDGSDVASYERRSVQVGISDFFFAEIQLGLKSGDVVTLEQPKDDLIKGGVKNAKEAVKTNTVTKSTSAGAGVAAKPSAPRT